MSDPRWQEIDQLFEEYLPPKTLDARTSGVQGPFSSSQGMENLLKDAGYHEIETVEISLPVTFKTPDEWYEFSWSKGQRGMWMRVPEHERSTLRSKAEELLMSHAHRDGSITFNQAIRHTLARK
jgi:hypothetical protein